MVSFATYLSLHPFFSVPTAPHVIYGFPQALTWRNLQPPTPHLLLKGDELRYAVEGLKCQTENFQHDVIGSGEGGGAL